MSLGYTVFPLSPRNNPTVTAYLLEKVGVHQLFVSEDLVMQTLAKEANKILSDKGNQPIALASIVRFAHLEDRDMGGALKDGIIDIADTDITVIMHSSGKSLPRRSENCIVK